MYNMNYMYNITCPNKRSYTYIYIRCVARHQLDCTIIRPILMYIKRSAIQFEKKNRHDYDLIIIIFIVVNMRDLG